MINVIIADDDYNARTGLTEMIDWSKLGANVIAAVEDGEQVIELMGQCSNVDLIILDICMPHMDGLSVAKYIRENECETEIILLSAHAEFEYAREALRYNVREYITKPINRTKLNQLTKAIEAVAVEKGQSISWRLYLHGAELREQVTSALRHRNSNALVEMFDIEQKFTHLGVKDIKEYFLVLLGHIREYYKSADKDTEFWEKCIKLFYEISEVKAMKTFLKESIESVMLGDGQNDGKSGTGIVTIAKEYINSNILSPDLHSYSVASHLNLSVDHLSRLFKAAGESSLSDYIIEAKLNKAKDIITSSTHSIRQVAQILGYTDPNYFVRVFKKKTGVTPTEFRTGAKERAE